MPKFFWVINSDVIVWTGLYDHLVNTRIFTLIMNKKFMRSENHEESGYGLDLDLLTMLH